MVTLAGGMPVVLRPQSDPFRPTLKEVEGRVTAKTRAIILNSPNNPSGVMYSRDFIAGAVELCERKDLYLLMDDTYNRLVFDGKTAPNPCEFARAPMESTKLVVFNSVSKTYAMPGFRIGWAIGNPALIKAASNIQSQQTSCASVPSQWAALGALEGDQSGVEALRATLEKNRNAMLEGLEDFPGLKVSKPDATFYCFPDFSAYDKDSGKLAEFLLDKARVLSVPGKEFGMDGHLRLSYCGSAQDVTEGVARIRWALDPKAPREITIGGRKVVRDWT
jgi:aspartate aminotransferase